MLLGFPPSQRAQRGELKLDNWSTKVKIGVGGTSDKQDPPNESRSILRVLVLMLRDFSTDKANEVFALILSKLVNSYKCTYITRSLKELQRHTKLRTYERCNFTPPTTRHLRCKG